MPASYATAAELESFLASGALDDVASGEQDRMLARATDLVDGAVRAPFTVNDESLPVDATIAEALRTAVCSQVEFWLEVGEEHDVAGLANSAVSVGHLRVDRLPPVLAPRARRALAGCGLLSIDSTVL